MRAPEDRGPRAHPPDDAPDGPPRAILHASAVAIDGRGLLILGPSGSGKSGLALALLALGATLVSDDRTELRLQGRALWLSPPEAIAGRIEARGLGILRLPARPAVAHAALDLARPEPDRLPQARETVIEGVALPLLHAVDSPIFPSMLALFLRHERIPT